MSEFVCPGCGHDQVQRLSLAVMNTAGGFAQIHAPPAKQGTGISSFVVMFSLVITVIFQSAFFVVVALVAAGFLMHAVFYNLREWPDLFEEWQKKWVCTRCGSVFEIDKPI